MTSRTVVRSIEHFDLMTMLETESTISPVLKCPVCGDTYSHVRAPYSLLGSDESNGGYPGAEIAAKTPEWRRDALTVRVGGENCGHEWEIVSQQHKGQTIVRIDILKPEPRS